MVTPAAGTVILVPFPFSDLSQAKLRPPVVLADSGRNDWILCQITSTLTEMAELLRWTLLRHVRRHGVFEELDEAHERQIRQLIRDGC